MSLLRMLLGRPLASSEEGSQRLGVLTGVPSLGLGALGSAAYGPEAALAILIPLGMGSLRYIGPITLIIRGLLFVLFLIHLAGPLTSLSRT